MKTAEQIIKMQSPGELFSSSESIKAEYKELARYWHPDLVTGNSEVMTHINNLYNEGIDLSKAGKWTKPNFLKVGKRELTYLTSFPFELGTCYIGNTFIAYFISKQFKELYDNARSITSRFVYHSEEMRKEISRYLPQELDHFETDEHLVLVYQKSPDLLLLRDVFEHFKNQIECKHVAWIQSRLHNIVAYLNLIQLSHNAINLNTCFVSPPHHTISLLGGWWYAVPFGQKMIGVPSRTYEVLTPKTKSDKIGTNQTDQELIRSVGRELLGDKNGTRLSSMKVAPEPMIQFLRGATKDNAFKDFDEWQKVLINSFGARKFIEFPVTATDLYKK